MTMKELMQAIKKDIRVRDFVSLQMAHLLPRLVERGGRLFADVYYYPVWQGDGPQTLRPLRMRVRYDLAGKRPVLLEELPETPCGDSSLPVDGAGGRQGIRGQAGRLRSFRRPLPVRIRERGGRERRGSRGGRAELAGLCAGTVA